MCFDLVKFIEAQEFITNENEQPHAIEEINRDYYLPNNIIMLYFASKEIKPMNAFSPNLQYTACKRDIKLCSCRGAQYLSRPCINFRATIQLAQQQDFSNQWRSTGYL